jgi:glutathione synthase/RimK-type ligase-like ATP-grasp enzyme
VAYSTDKHYLADLAKHGVAIIPSHFCDVGKKPRFFDGDFVVKPCVGAGSMDVERYGPSEHDAALAHVKALHASGRDVLIQPYVDSVDALGERALIFIDGAYSHAMTKGAMLNVTEMDRSWLFRHEQMSLVEGESDAIAFAQHVLEVKGFAHLLYARVDLVTTKTGWELMELELVEPSLFLTYEPAAATRLAEAIARRVA